MRYLKNVTSQVNLREWWGIHGGRCDPLVVDAGPPTLFVEDNQFPLRFADFGSVVRQQHDDLKQILRLKGMYTHFAPDFAHRMCACTMSMLALSTKIVSIVAVLP
eukprot:GHVN01038167.1.p1 GENE.GHVN01038167.1~~GHVN01038167.1.p1  ORF type:complete len:105 (+),score=5.63 GHVN01038167.1:149-463(+)